MMQPVCAAGIFVFDAHFPLISIIVPLERLADTRVQLFGRKFFRFLCRCDQFQIGAERKFLLRFIPLRRHNEIPVHAQHDDGKSHQPAHFAHRVGQKRSATV